MGFLHHYPASTHSPPVAGRVLRPADVGVRRYREMTMEPHLETAGPATGGEIVAISLLRSGALAQEILAALRLDARAAAACLWRRTPEGMRLEAAAPPDLPLGGLIPGAGGIVGEVAAAGVIRLLADTAGASPGEEIPLFTERVPTGAAALLPLSDPGAPAPALVTLHWPHPPAGFEQRLFSWSRWARLLALIPPAASPPPPLPGHPARSWPSPEDGLPRVAGGLARRMHEQLSGVLPSLHRAIRLTGEGEPSRRFLHHVDEGLDRTFHLLARLAAFAGEAPLLTETVSVADCACEAVRRLEPERPPAVRLTASIPRGLPKIVADRVQITSALMEVLRNALEAAPDGTGVRLELTADEDGLTVWICDEGAGMAAEVLERAVIPFFSTRHPSRHAGLGLSVVQGCMDRHGGKLAISSGPGRGTRVRLWFPPQVRSPEG